MPGDGFLNKLGKAGCNTAYYVQAAGVRFRNKGYSACLHAGRLTEEARDYINRKYYQCSVANEAANPTKAFYINQEQAKALEQVRKLMISACFTCRDEFYKKNN